MSTESGHAPNWEDCQHPECLSERGIEEGMTPELEAKARELDCWARRLAAYWPLGSWEKPERAQQRVEFFRGELELYIASQLSAERTWWITRIERERDKWDEANKPRGEGWVALDDLLTSVRERGGK